MKYAPIAASIAAALAMTSAAPALAQSAGDIRLGVGFGVVAPADDNGSLAGGALDVNVGDDVRPTLTFEYFLRDNLGLEVLAATPFEHDIKLNGAKAGSTKHLPPTISLNYYIPTGGDMTPFVGAGINYTAFFSEKTTGSLDGANLSLDDSFGLALHAGVDFKISDKGALRADVRWIDIDTDVKVNGTKVGTTKIDPIVFGISYIHTF